MSHAKKNNNFISYVIILIGLFVLVFFTKGQIYAIPENNDIKEKLKLEETEKRTNLTRLEIQQKELNNSSSKKFKEISRFEIDIKENEIIEFLYGYVFTALGGAASINNLSIGEGKIGELGFKESNIGLNIKVANENVLIKLLKYLGNQDKYNFYIESIGYPYEKSARPFTVNIPIRVLYK